MARIKLAHVASDIRGSVGGTTFSNYRGQAYLKTKSGRINRATPRQTIRRSIFGQLNQQWRSLPESTKDTYRRVKLRSPVRNRFGDPIELTPLAKYTLLLNSTGVLFPNTTAYEVAQRSIYTPQPLTLVLNPSFLGLFVILTGSINIFSAIHLQCTQPFPASRKPKSRDYRTVFRGGNGSSSTIVFTNQYKAVFGQLPQVGSRVGCRLMVRFLGVGPKPVWSYIDTVAT